MRKITSCLLVFLFSFVDSARFDPGRWVETLQNVPEALKKEANSYLLATKDKKDFDHNTDPWVEQIAVHPRIYYYHNFLTENERIHMIEVAAPQLKRSTVYNLTTHGDEHVESTRTSYGTFLRRLQDPVIASIEQRIAMSSLLPVAHQEPIQVVRYDTMQSYDAHWDFLWEENDRVATFLMYLNDVESGGETTFPEHSQWLDPSFATKWGPWSDCAKGHVAIKPKKGDALMFWALTEDGKRDEASMHAACPVLKGVKWAAPVWIHASPFRPAELYLEAMEAAQAVDPGLCQDTHRMCGNWATDGMCAANPEFMMGGFDSLGACRMSCQKCSVCSSGDADCINRNRDAHGYLKLQHKELESLGLHFWQIYDKNEL